MHTVYYANERVLTRNTYVITLNQKLNMLIPFLVSSDGFRMEFGTCARSIVLRHIPMECGQCVEAIRRCATTEHLGHGMVGGTSGRVFRYNAGIRPFPVRVLGILSQRQFDMLLAFEHSDRLKQFLRICVFDLCRGLPQGEKQVTVLSELVWICMDKPR
jgi:hypothetical protein